MTVRRLVPALFLICALEAPAQNAAPGDFLCAPFGPNGTWNLYQASEKPATWAAAQKLAAGIKDPKGGTGKMGHLVTIGSAAENMFVYQHVEGWYIWIGLSDNENYGGMEAGSNRGGNWAWVTGEPCGSFAPWRSVEPNAATDGGEDGVALEYGGRWADWPIGEGGEVTQQFPYLIEWDTALPAPVPGTRVIGRVLPEKWPADLLAGSGTREGPGPWTLCSADSLKTHSVREMVADFLPRLKPDIRRYGAERLNYRAHETRACPGGWIALTDAPKFPGSGEGIGALQITTVRITTPGVWSFSMHCDDFFAARFPGLKWKRVTGLAGIDPLDPETMFFDTECPNGFGIGVIELPAGDHRLEIFTGNRMQGMMLQFLAAPGEFSQEGGTDKWRLPGHRKEQDVAWPGISAEGWKVIRTLVPESSRPLKNLRRAFALSKSDPGLEETGVEVLNYTDPEAPGDSAFPAPRPFPADAPGDQDHFAVMAAATLVIPRDGLYHIGVDADSHAALCIGGEKINTVIRDTGLLHRVDGDTLWEEVPDRMGNGAQIVGQVRLKKGEYPIEVLYGQEIGPASLSVFGGPGGFPPRLLKKGGAVIEPDTDGLPMVPVP